MIKLKKSDFDHVWGKHHLMVTAAHRYCLGRQTYIVGSCVDWLISNWSYIDPSAKIRIVEETKEAIEKDCAGVSCDISDWAKLIEFASTNK